MTTKETVARCDNERKPKMKTEFILNEHGEGGGEQGYAKDVWVLGEYKPEKFDYTIEVSTLHPGTAIDGESAGVRVPVGSVGRSGLQYFYAADDRFANYPGIECVFPGKEN